MLILPRANPRIAYPQKKGMLRFKGARRTIDPNAPIFPHQVLLDALEKINKGE